MANRFPLIVDNVIKELPSGDNLDLTGSGIVNAGAVAATSVTVSGQITGVTNLAMTGTVTGGTNTTISGTFTGAQVDILAEGDLRLQDASGGEYVAIQAPSTIAASYTLTMPADDGDADQYLQTNGSGVLDWATVTVPPSAYNTFAIKTTAYTAVAGDQLIANHASTAFTITLPLNPTAGNSVSLKNVGAALLTVGRNSQPINSTAENATMPTGNASQLVYINSTIGWTTL